MSKRLSDEEIQRRRAILDKNLRERIARNGWAMMGVFDPDGVNDMFLYTIGLTEKNLHELIMVDVLPQHREYVANLLDFAAAKHAEKAFSGGDILKLDDFNGAAQSVRFVTTDAGRLGFALGFYGNNVRALLVEPILDNT